MQKQNEIVQMTFEFALDIIEYTEKLEGLRKYNLSNQLFRSGTSIGANTREAQGSESRADFIHKFKLAHKEAEETNYWLELCSASPHYPDPGPLSQKIRSILRVIGKIIYTAKSSG